MTAPAVQSEFGPVALPLPDQINAANLLSVADPGLERVLGFIKFFIETDVAEALTGALAASSPPVPQTVTATSTLDPGTIDKAEQVRFPLLSLWRKSSVHNERTLSLSQRTSTLGWSYILPPMTYEQASKYIHILTIVESAVNRALSTGYHPDYNGGFPIIDGSGIVELRLGNATRETSPFGELTNFYAVVGEMEMAELSTDNIEDFGAFDAADYSIGVGSEADGIIPDLIQGDSSVPVQSG